MIVATSHRYRRAVATLLLASSLVLGAKADAANFERCSPGILRVWDHDPAFVFDASTFPDDDFRADLQSAIDRWNGVRGMFFEISSLDEDTTPGADIEDGINEVFFVPGLVGAHAATDVRFVPWLFGCTVLEADIVFDSESPWENGAHDPTVRESGEINFRRAAVHEIGHVIGLEHEDDVPTLMMTFEAPFWSGSEELRSHPFPDELLASRVLYFHPNESSDLAISNFRREPPDDVATILPPETRTAVRNQDFDIGFGVGNLGTEFVETDAIVVLSSDDAIEVSDTIVGSYRIAVPPGVYSTFSATVTVPADAVPGEYFVGAILDPADALAERREGNNRARFPGTLVVLVEVAPECIEDEDCPEPGQVCSEEQLCAFTIGD